MTGPVSRRNLFKVGSGVAAAGLGAAIASPARAQGPETEVIWHSKLVYPGADGKLNYAADNASGRKIPNFSWAGYRNGEAPIPDVPTALTIGPLPPGQDNTAHINDALAEVGAMTMDANGIRGALKLEPGLYEVAGTVEINSSGVVLRGSGRSGDPAVGTIIKSTSTGGLEQGGVECPVRIRSADPNAKWERPVGPSIPVIESVEAGSRRLKLAPGNGLAVGDNIIIWHRCTAKWIGEIDNGGVDNDPPWPVDSEPIMYNRFVKAIQGEETVICAPVFNDLDIALSEITVHKWDNANEVRNSGIEDLRVDMPEPVTDDQNARSDSCIVIERTRDTWVRNVATLRFKQSGVMVRRSHRVTVEDVWALEPRSELEGRRRYNFCAGYMAQQVLFTDVVATEARHAFIAGGGASTSGVVWLDAVSKNGYLESGGHAHWSQGLLFDNVYEQMNDSPPGTQEKDVVLNLHNRQDSGGDEAGGRPHGWSSVYSVLWNCKLDNDNKACVQRPPTSQNFAIGTSGNLAEVVTDTNWLVTEEPGYVEDKAGTLEPVSLYRKQLADRLA
ncbi:hypothetical protein AB0K52_06285 [Glycomyces sp. NPDC049804]|uniref:hypothetical protein n=1 Tax=Glycomyces sp. NPDC049804 TaxID=3154363 RepID=UPI0034295979